MFEISNTCDDSWLARAFEDVVECILMQLRVQTHPLARLFIFKHIKKFKRTLIYYDTDTEPASFRGNPFVKRHKYT